MSYNNDISLADIGAVVRGNTRDDGLFGGCGIAGLFALFLIYACMGWGGFGGFGMGGMMNPWMMGGFGGYGNYATAADVQRGFDNQAVINKLNGLENGLASLGYDQLAQMNGINTNVMQGFHGVDNAVCTLGYQNAQLINGMQADMMRGFGDIGHQISDCCCESQRLMERGFCDAQYRDATNTSAIIQNAHNDTDRIIAKLDCMETNHLQELLAAERAKNQRLEFAASQNAQTAQICGFIGNQKSCDC